MFGCLLAYEEDRKTQRNLKIKFKRILNLDIVRQKKARKVIFIREITNDFRQGFLVLQLELLEILTFIPMHLEHLTRETNST